MTPVQPREGDRLAALLRGLGPVGIVAALMVLLLGSRGGLPALVWARLSRTPWRDLGFVRPRNVVVTAVIGILSGAAFKLLMKCVVMPLLGASPINPAYHFLVGNAAALPRMIFTVVVLAGFSEELVFRGFLFERLGRLLGRSAGARVATVLLSAAYFSLAHYSSQGRDGSVQALITGLVFGTTFALTGEIWLLMIAHASFDLTAVWMIYNDLETWFAHLVFK